MLKYKAVYKLLDYRLVLQKQIGCNEREVNVRARARDVWTRRGGPDGSELRCSAAPRGWLEVGRTSDRVEGPGARRRRSQAGIEATPGSCGPGVAGRRAASPRQGLQTSGTGKHGALGALGGAPSALPLSLRPHSPESRVPPLSCPRAPGRVAGVKQGGHGKVQNPDPQGGLCVPAPAGPKAHHCSNSSPRFLEAAPKLPHLLVSPSPLPARTQTPNL